MGKRVKTEKDKRKSFKKAYLTQRQACHKLQISLREFRRLCILKGIYPREPRRHAHGPAKTKIFYFSKDISWLSQESLLGKLREYKVYRKKHTKLIGRGELYQAHRFQWRHKPSYTLHHIVKERYPSFVAALRDMGDALTHIALYVNLPAHIASSSSIEGHGFLTSGLLEKCSERYDAWKEYVVKTNSLRKVFISVRGYYFQADVCGETITWMEPHVFTNKPPTNVDYRVMLTFAEFWVALVGFVAFKLEHDYDKRQKAEEEKSLEMNPVLAATAGAEEPAGAPAEAVDFPVEEAATARQKEAQLCKELFAGLTFTLGVEVPRKHIEFVLRCCGAEVLSGAIGGDGKVHSTISLKPRAHGAGHGPHMLMDGSGRMRALPKKRKPTTQEKKVPEAEESAKEEAPPPPTVTHHIIDRPPPANLPTDRDYVQPQWAFDCVNARRLLPVDPYAPGHPLPPHLSPFDDSVATGLDFLRGAPVEGLVNLAAGALQERKQAPPKPPVVDGPVAYGPGGLAESDSDPDLSGSDAERSEDDKLTSDDDDDDDDDENAVKKTMDADTTAATPTAAAGSSSSPTTTTTTGQSTKKEKKAATAANLPPMSAQAKRQAKERNRRAKLKTMITPEEEQEAKQKKVEEREKERKMQVMKPKDRRLMKAIDMGINRKNRDAKRLAEKRKSLNAGVLAVKRGRLVDTQ